MGKNPKTGAPGKPATLDDVARYAGVSAMTVSRVVNGVVVKQATRDRVLAAVAHLRYRSAREVRNVVDGGPIRIGVLYSNPSAGYHSEFFVGLINEASASGIQLVVDKVDQQHSVESVNAFLAGSFDAIIVAPPLSDNGALVDCVVGKGIAVILVGPAKADSKLSSVGVDHYGASMKMTNHLVALGHERIGFITGSPTHSATNCRLSGFRDAMRNAGLPVPDEMIVPGLFTYNSGLVAAEALLTLPSRPTAVFASNDDMAAAAVAVAHRMGIDVPGDLTVVGCDDTPIATSTRPQLTTIRQPIRMMAANAVKLILQEVQAQRQERPFTPQVLTMDCDLVRRQSDAAPKKRSPVLTRPAPRALIRT